MIFSLFRFLIDETNSLSQTIPDKPIELRHFIKLCEQRRKYPVLYKLEFQVTISYIYRRSPTIRLFKLPFFCYERVLTI